MIVQEAANSSIDVKEHIDALLETVFHIFGRISLSRESDEDFLPVGKYQQLVYDNFLFDMAKLYDIAGIYGP